MFSAFLEDISFVMGQGVDEAASEGSAPFPEKVFDIGDVATA